MKRINAQERTEVGAKRDPRLRLQVYLLDMTEGNSWFNLITGEKICLTATCLLEFVLFIYYFIISVFFSFFRVKWGSTSETLNC